MDNTPDSYNTSMQYDTYGNITSITDPESNTVTFNYSSNYSYAYLTEISATVGTDTKTTKATYDYDRGWITSIQEPKGVAGSGYDTVYTYDVLGRIIKKEFPLLDGQSEPSSLEAVYDCENRTTTLIDQLGHYIVQEYDRLGRNTSIKQYTGQYGSGTLYATTLYTYRYDNLLISVTDPRDYTTTYTYDFLGRKTQISYPDSSSVLYSYNDTDNTVTYTDAKGFDTVYWYDVVNQLIKVEKEYESGLFAQTVYQYDEAGHLTTMTDAENNATTFEYGSLFGVTKTVYPDSTYEEYDYDNAGNVTHFTDAKGDTTTYTYDSIYQLTQIQYQDGSTVSFLYDLNDNRVTMEDNAPDTGDYTVYVYDNWNRLTSKTRYIAEDSYTVSYQYDTANRVTKLTYPDDMQVVYSYDDLNRMTQIKRVVDGGNDEVVLDNIQYNTGNFLTQAEYGNGLTGTFSYDSRERVLTLDIKDGATSYLDLDYTYDNNGNITQLVNGWRDTNLNWHSDTETYTYDGLNRVTSADCTSWSHTYTYDTVGNRTSKDSVTYTINTVNEVTDLNNGTSFVYDLNGNRTQKTKGTDTWDYTYDYANRLIKIEENSSVIGEFVYDGDGNRLQKTENGDTTIYIRRGTQVLYEENSNGTATYIYGPTGRIAKRTTVNQETNTFYYHKDHLDSTRLVTDRSKNIVAAVRYHPFGGIDITEGEESYLYTGQEKDFGLSYYGARYYDCNVGRFITRDVYTWLPDDPRSSNTGKNAKWLETPQKFNRFSYAQNNPVKYNDPTGFCCEMGNFSYREQVNIIETGRVSGIHRNFPIRMDLRRLGMMINPQENFRLRLNWSFGPLSGGDECYWVVVDCNGDLVKDKEGNVLKFPDTPDGIERAAGCAGARETAQDMIGNCPHHIESRCGDIESEGSKGSCAGTFLILYLFGMPIFSRKIQSPKKCT